MKNISKSDLGTCEECGTTNVIVDWNNKDNKKVCEKCWYKLGYDKVN